MGDGIHNCKRILMCYTVPSHNGVLVVFTRSSIRWRASTRFSSRAYSTPKHLEKILYMQAKCLY